MAHNSVFSSGNSSAVASQVVINAVKGIGTAVVNKSPSETLASIGLTYDDSSGDEGSSSAEDQRGSMDVDIGVDVDADRLDQSFTLGGHDRQPYSQDRTHAQSEGQFPTAEHAWPGDTNGDDTVRRPSAGNNSDRAKSSSEAGDRAGLSQNTVSDVSALEGDGMEQLVELAIDPNDDILAEESAHNAHGNRSHTKQPPPPASNEKRKSGPE